MEKLKLIIFILFITLNYSQIYSQNSDLSELVILTDTTKYIRNDSSKSYFAIINNSTEDVYFFICGNIKFEIQKRKDNIWERFGGVICDGFSAYQNIKVEAGEYYSSYFTIFYEPGIYRLVFFYNLDSNLTNYDSLKSNEFMVSELSTSIDKEQKNELNISNIYPNPSNPISIIEYSVNKETNIKIEIIDILGRCIKILTEIRVVAGNYKLQFSVDDLRSGIYFIKVSSNKFTKIQKLIVLK
ncbi:MAG: T9SS type A sorting domain-containing protein [Melioribacteraceae bacterium]